MASVNERSQWTSVFDKGISANEKKLNKQYQRGFAAKRK